MMLGTVESVLLYYAAASLAIILFWAACVPDRVLSGPDVQRYTRWATVAALGGLVHPGIAVAARGILADVAVDLPDRGPGAAGHRRATVVVNALVVVSLAATLAVVTMAVVASR
jgi:hypothetical protein